MKTLLKQVLITPGNYPRIYARVIPQDQREAIRPGISIAGSFLIRLSIARPLPYSDAAAPRMSGDAG